MSKYWHNFLMIRACWFPNALLPTALCVCVLFKIGWHHDAMYFCRLLRISWCCPRRGLEAISLDPPTMCLREASNFEWDHSSCTNNQKILKKYNNYAIKVSLDLSNSSFQKEFVGLIKHAPSSSSSLSLARLPAPTIPSITYLLLPAKSKATASASDEKRPQICILLLTSNRNFLSHFPELRNACVVRERCEMSDSYRFTV